MKKLYILGLLFIFILVSCQKLDQDNIIAVKVTKVEITNKLNKELVVNEEAQLGVKITPLNATFKDIIWFSSNTSILTVSDKGKIKALRKGTATITAFAKEDNIKDTYTVKVNNPNILAESIKLSQKELVLKLNETSNLSAEILPANTSDKTVKWSIDNDKIATVVDGKITALSIGEAIISATTKNDLKATCKLIVKSNVVEVTSIVINKGNKYTTTTDFVMFKANVLPENAENKTIVWSTSDKSIGTIGTTGSWLGKKAGTCTITATASNGVSASCELTYDYTPVTGINMPSDITVNLEEEFTITSSILPSNASNAWIEEPVITGPDGGLIYDGYGSKGGSKYTWMGITAGVYTVKYITEDGAFEGTCNVTVVDPNKPSGTFKFTLGKVYIPKGEKLLVEMEYKPANMPNKEITWSTSDETIASVETFVNESGDGSINAFIKTHKVGICTLTATLENGLSSTCEVNVTEPKVLVESITLNKESFTLKVGESIDLGIKVLPENASNKELSFSTWNKDLVSFEDGKLKGLKAGTTKFTLTADDGSYVSVSMVDVTVVENDIPSSICIDPDGREYMTVVIGNQTWMAENYAYLPKVNLVTIDSYDEACFYVYDYMGTDVSEAKATVNYSKYGVLYNKIAAVENAPKGWHLPTDAEWKTLEENQGMSQEDSNKEGFSIRGSKEICSKFKAVEGWGTYGGINSNKMSIIPAGKRNIDSEFDDITYKTAFWTNTPGNVKNSSYRREFVYYSSSIMRSSKGSNKNGFSVRYVKD